MIEDLVEDAREELKRADHSIFVSLKYARTVDIIKGTIKRLINAFEIAVSDALLHLKEKKKVKSIPAVARLRAELIKELIPKIDKYIDLYYLLKQIDKAEYTKKEEYRKNVTLIAIVEPGKTVEVNIDTLHKYFLKTVEFLDLLDTIVHVKKEE